jgi:hypothetical protein
MPVIAIPDRTILRDNNWPAVSLVGFVELPDQKPPVFRPSRALLTLCRA